MGRFEPTGAIGVPGLEHSIAQLPWGVIRGAFGPSDGSAGAASNVPSALAVLRHAPLYLHHPIELEEAFAVLERHAIRHGVLYPVAITTVPFLFDIVRRGSLAAERITNLIAEYASAADTLELRLTERLFELITDHAAEVTSWLGIHDRAVAALALYVPAIRAEVLRALATVTTVAPELLLVLVDLQLDTPPGRTVELALALLDGNAPDVAKMCAAAFLARHGEQTPEMRTRIDAALPPSAPAALRIFVGKLWTPTVDRPVVAPRLFNAEVVFSGEKLVLVRAGDHSVTLPWTDSNVGRGDIIQIGITAHGQPKLAVVTAPDGSVRVIDF